MAKKLIKRPKARMPASKKPVKQTDKKLSLTQKTLALLRSHKLIVFLSVLVLLFPASFVYEKYKDWDNAQMIKGLAKDFPELVGQIEAVTGLDLEIKRDCMTTSEKSGSGVRTCELSFVNVVDQELINKYFSVVEGNSKFKKSKVFENNQGYKFKYRNKDYCSFRNTKTIYASCLFAVREANIQLAIDQLSK